MARRGGSFNNGAMSSAGKISNLHAECHERERSPIGSQPLTCRKHVIILNYEYSQHSPKSNPDNILVFISKAYAMHSIFIC